jgi:ATP diphosphatase
LTASTEGASQAIERLLRIMSMLRDPDFGCPWDLEQSMESLVPFTIEEVYEVVDAIERGDMVDLEDELGDLLFQVVFYAQLAGESGYFRFAQVAEAISDKLIRRHPHVFPHGKLESFASKPDISADQVVVNWDAIKEQEKAEKRAKRGDDTAAVEQASSALDDVPRALPSLERSRKLQKRAARLGFDWSDVQPVIAKLKEEIEEYEEAVATADKGALQHELGDILFAAVNLARHTGVEPEIALRDANQRFENRFRWIEQELSSRGTTIEDATLETMDELWGQAKATGL